MNGGSYRMHRMNRMTAGEGVDEVLTGLNDADSSVRVELGPKRHFVALMVRPVD